MEPKPTSRSESAKEQADEKRAPSEAEPMFRREHGSAPAHAPVKLRKFEAPREIAEKFGVTTQSEELVTGLIKTEDVRELLDAFGLQDRGDVVFPFQHIKRQHGEIWAMRIEGPAAHMIEGKPVMAHAWVFQQAWPERVAGVQ
jgi:hypothetical protein